MPSATNQSSAAGPGLRHCDELGFDLRPIMQGRRVEVGAVGPDQRVGVVTERHRVEDAQVLQRPEEPSFENRQEVDATDDAVFEGNLEFVRPDDGERRYAVHWVLHMR